MKHLHIAAALLCAAAASANAYTLDFGTVTAPVACTATTDGTGPQQACNTFGFLSQDYGDVAGVADISYSAPRVAGPNTLYWWSSSYNNLFGVAFAPGGDSDSLARIEIKPVQPGDAVTLTGFDLGAYPSTTRSTHVNIYAVGGGTPLYTYVGDVGDVGDGGTAATHFTVDITSGNGLWIEWSDSAYNVGIDNIQFSVSAVPEPSALLLMLGGVAALVARRRTVR